MALIGPPDQDYTIWGIRKETSYINKYSAVDNMRYPPNIPMEAVTTYILYVIRLCILQYVLPESVLYWKVCYKYFLFKGYSSTEPEWYLHLYWYVCASYNGVSIGMFLYDIHSNCWLYLILGILFYKSPMHCLFRHCVIVTYEFLLICLWMLYLCLLKYVCVLHNI